jgi:hypothetical protein
LKVTVVELVWKPLEGDDRLGAGGGDNGSASVVKLQTPLETVPSSFVASIFQ